MWKIIWKRTIVEGFKVANEFDVFIDGRFFGVDGPSQHVAAELHVIFSWRTKTMKWNAVTIKETNCYYGITLNNLYVSNRQKHWEDKLFFVCFFTHLLSWHTKCANMFWKRVNMSECSEQQHWVSTETQKEEMNPSREKTKQKVGEKW